jgi:hypothetical protein
MNMIGKVAASLVAAGAFSAVIFASTSADSIKPVQFMVAAAADTPQSRIESFSNANEFTRLVEEPSPASGPLNSKETPQDQLNDLQYN